MNTAQKITMFIGSFVLAFAFLAGTGHVANAATTYHCDPPENGSEVDLASCEVAAAGAPVPDGQIAVVVGDMPVGGSAVREPVADHSWMNGFVFGSLPTAPVAEDEIYVAKGDILGNSRCAVTVFESGDEVVIYSEATWQLVRIYEGSEADRWNEALFVAEKAQREVGGAKFCPFVEPSDLHDPYADLAAVENGTVELPAPDDDADADENASAEAAPAEADDETADNGGALQAEQLGLNVLPDGGQVPADSLLMLHGDVRANGTCEVMVFSAGETVDVAGGTWQSVLISGGSSDLQVSKILEIQEQVAPCPSIRTPEGLSFS